jgi:hypothetical protein
VRQAGHVGRDQVARLMGPAGSEGLAGARSARPQRLIRPLNGSPIWSNGSFPPSARTGLWVSDLTHVAT